MVSLVERVLSRARDASWDTAKSDIRKQYPSLDPKRAKTYDAASNLTRATHAKFQNAKSGVGGVNSDLWEDISEDYMRALRLWNTFLADGDEGVDQKLMTNTHKIRQVCNDRENEAKKEFRRALDLERIEENARWERDD